MSIRPNRNEREVDANELTLAGMIDIKAKR